MSKSCQIGRSALLAAAATLMMFGAASIASAAPQARSSNQLAGLPDWTTFQGNSAHTGFVPVKLDPGTFAQMWQIPVTPVQVGSLPGVASFATSNGLVFVSGGSTLSAFSESDGNLVWKHDFSDLQYPSVNPPAVSKGVVYVAAGQQSSTSMFGFDAATGTQAFKSPMSAQWENYLAPTVGDAGVYTNAGAYGGLYGFKPDGTQRFFVDQNQQSMWTPAVDGSGVVAYTGFLQVVDPKTGAVKHQIQDDTFVNYTYIIGGSPVLGANGHVFVANYTNAQLNGGTIGNTLLAFSTSTDSIKWKAAGVYPTTPAYEGGTVFAVNNLPLQLEARAEKDGALRWTWAPTSGDQHFVSEVLLTKNLVFVSTDVATYAISRKTLKTVWRSSLTGKLGLSKGGVFYIQGEATLTAYKVD